MLCLIGVMVISTVRFLQSACGFSQNCIPIIELSSHAVIQNYLSSSDGAGARKKKERQRQTRPRDDDGYWEPDLREPNPTFVSDWVHFKSFLSAPLFSSRFHISIHSFFIHRTPVLLLLARDKARLFLERWSSPYHLSVYIFFPLQFFCLSFPCLLLWEILTCAIW